MTPKLQKALESPINPGTALHTWQMAEERLFARKQQGRKWSASLTSNGFKSFKATITRKL